MIMIAIKIKFTNLKDKDGTILLCLMMIRTMRLVIMLMAIITSINMGKI